MSIIDTLITNRTQADVDSLLALYAKPKAMWTVEEWNEFLLGNHRGAYNATDMNRVLDALDYLADRVTEFGYQKPDIKRPNITEVIPGTSRLPEGYTELEYIQSSGTQYVNAGYKPTPNTRVEADIDFLPGNTTYNCIFGAGSKGSDQFVVYRNNSTSMVGQVYSTEHITTQLSITGRKLVVLSSSLFAYGEYSAELTAGTFTCDYPLFLFALNRADSAMYHTHQKVYSCQIYDNGTLVRDYVPCLNNSNEVGLYDIVNGVFYGNAGTGYFLPGPAVSLPEGYTRLDHIKSTGTQYIDSGVCPTNNTRVICELSDYSRTEVNTAAFGTRTSASSSERYCLLCAANTTSYRTDFYNNNADVSTSYSISDRGVIDKNKNVTLINGVAVATNTSGSFTSKYNMTLFALNTGGSVAQKASFKMYLFVVYENDVLSRLYTPVMNKNGEVGLYDTITGVFFGNAGSGAFVAGKEMESSGSPSTITRDYYKIGDRPTTTELANYLDNVAHVRGVLDIPDGVPAVPADISQRITVEEANNIEIILTAVELLLNRIPLSWFYAGEIYSGEV